MPRAIRLRRAADGTYRWFLTRGVPLRDPQGHILKWYGILLDIEDRKRMEESLRESEIRFRELVNSVEGIVWEADVQSLAFSFVMLGLGGAGAIRPRRSAISNSFRGGCTGRMRPKAPCGGPRGQAQFL